MGRVESKAMANMALGTEVYVAVRRLVTFGTGWVKANHEDTDERSKDKEGRLGSSQTLVAITKEVWVNHEHRVSSKC